MPRTPEHGGTPEVQTNEQKFEAAFGAPPSEVSPQQIIERLSGLYDKYKEFQSVGAMHENHSGRGYFERAGVRDWQDWREKLGAMGDELKTTIDTAQPFVQEDLSFLETLRGGDHVAKSRTLTEVWKPKEKGSYDAITKTQQEILRGKITKVLKK